MVLNHILEGTDSLRKSDIARMSNDELSRLNYDTMVELVLASELPVQDVKRIRSFEGETVSHLARMARDYCRQTGNGVYAQK